MRSSTTIASFAFAATAFAADLHGPFGFNHALFNANAYETSADLHLARPGVAYGL